MAYLGTAPPSASNMMFIFVDTIDDEIGGLCQNGSVISAEISGWMQIVYTLLLINSPLSPALGNRPQ